MPQFDSVEDYDRALEALGVIKIDYAANVKASKRRLFMKSSREAFEAFLRAHELSTSPMKYRNQFIGYIRSKVQGLWCTWVDALCTTSTVPLAAPDAVVQLFCIEMAARGYDTLTPDEVVSRTASLDLLLRWDAWNDSLRFWETFSAQNKLQ